MRIETTANAARELTGRIVRVDVINRALTLQADGRTVDLDVPPGCAVVLNGQPVRLRLIQPQDRVRVRVEAGGVTRIDVNP
ncbi:MAG TPA: hypothetical protein VGF55_23570 [Gemmataceae bacterium]|jgi:hypothetical protein